MDIFKTEHIIFMINFHASKLQITAIISALKTLKVKMILLLP